MVAKIKIKIILGSTRQGRFGDKPASWLYEELKKDESIDVELLDLRDYNMPYFNDSGYPSMHKGPYADPIVQRWSEKIDEADAFAIVAPEYNHGYPAVLKNAFDVIYREWNNKPVGFVSYGSAMGARVIEQLREVAIELQMAPIRNAIHIPFEVYMNAAGKNPPLDPSIFDPIRKSPMGDRLSGFKDQLLWWARALKAAREAKS